MYAGSSRVGTLFKNVWNKIKSWYGNSAEKLKPITDILVNAGTNAANNVFNKSVNYISNKTGSDIVKQIANVVGNMAKDTVSDVANQIQGKASKNTTGAGYDISNLDNETTPIAVPTKEKESNPHSHSSEREQDTQVDNSKESVLGKLYMHGYMNVDAEPMTFDEVRKLAKQLEIPDFDVMELNKYKRLAKKYKEPANCIIWIPFEDDGSLRHYVSCFRESDGTLN